MMKRILFAFFVLSMALSATAQRVYINPGHGDWGPLSRPMATVNYAAYDTLGFFESNTNLWKAFALQEKLVAAGYTVMMSRTENGPYPYVYGDESIDKPLLDIGAEANLFGADYFISIHSNAYEDGALVNYPLFLYAGTDDGENIPNSISMATAAWPRHFEAFGKDTDDKNITQGFEPNSNYSRETPNLRGDESFYGDNGLGVLEILTSPGYLVEGYFHTYQPARHRALNPDWCRQEGIRYFRGIQDYYKKPGEQVGYIMGCIRDISEWFSHAYYTPMQSSFDPFKPINGAKVVLRDASGNIIRTECYRHVARHMTDQYYYTTDHNYNGIFVFENLQPGTYTLTVHAAGYQDESMEVDVEADKTVYPEIFLTKGQGTEPHVDVQWVLNGGTVDGTLPSKIEGSEYPLPTPTRAGYIFQGWYNTNNTSGNKLTTLPVGYTGTVYAIWRPAKVTWELNGGHVSENKLLWEDFQKTILPNDPLVSIEDASTVINTVGGKEIYDHLKKGGIYEWLGDYLWYKASGIDQGLDVYARWGIWLNTFLKCTTYTVDGKTLDFTEAGKYDSWKSWATEEIRQKVTLPDQITSDYTIPTPEKEGYDFLGWYDNPYGMGDPIPVLHPNHEGIVYAIWQEPVPCIVAYDLNCKYKPGAMAFDFSFYANTQPASGKLIFYNEKGQNTKEIELSNLHQGKNTYFISVKDIPEFEVGKDIFWEVHLEARPSTLFAEIFRSESFNTAYATIDNSPESDFFGSIWVANQQDHGYNTNTGGEIWRLIPEQGYARDAEKGATKGHRPHRPGNPNPNTENEEGFEVIFRPTVAPDGKVYITDNGSSYGGVFVMDPHTKEITNFFEGCTHEPNGEWKEGVQVVGSGSTGAHIYWTENKAKLYLIHNTHPNAAGKALGFFQYDLMTNGELEHTAINNTMVHKAFADGYRGAVTDYAIVGSSHGIWVCNVRYENSTGNPSLSFYSNNGTVTYFEDPNFISGSWGAAVAVNHDETILVMVDRNGDLLQFGINWSGDVPSLENKQVHQIFNATTGHKNTTITTLNFDYAGNLVATLGDSYDDENDHHQVAIFTMPKTPNQIDVPSRSSQRVPGFVEDEQYESVPAANKRYETILLNRKLQSGMYNTICLPFGLTTLTDTPLEGSSVLAFEGSTVDTKGGEPVLKLNFQEVTAMTACVPYLIKPLQDIKDPMLFRNVETGKSVEARPVVQNGITFQGVMDPTDELPHQNMLMLVANNRLATSTGGTMLGNRGYFVIDNPQNMPKRAEIAIVKGTSSSDNNIHVDDYPPTVTKVLENGVIFIIRDGVKYNLMGARIK